MDTNIEGRIFYCGDYVNTDVMAPGRYDPIYEDEKLAEIALIDYKGEEPFVCKLKNRTNFPIIVAGQDFGCGSSRETAPLALAAAGLKVIVAKSFARIFFRNCINLGTIIPITIDHNFEKNIHGTDGVIDINKHYFKTKDTEYNFSDFGILQGIFNSKGLSNHVKKYGRIKWD